MPKIFLDTRLTKKQKELQFDLYSDCLSNSFT
jgi:hypothetical protein